MQKVYEENIFIDIYILKLYIFQKKIQNFTILTSLFNINIVNTAGYFCVA